MGNLPLNNGEVHADGDGETRTSSPDSGGSFVGGLAGLRRPSWIRPSWSMTFRRSRSGSSHGGSSPSPTAETLPRPTEQTNGTVGGSPPLRDPGIPIDTISRVIQSSLPATSNHSVQTIPTLSTARATHSVQPRTRPNTLTQISYDPDLGSNLPPVDSEEESPTSSLESLCLDPEFVLRGGARGRNAALPSGVTVLLRLAIKTLKKESESRDEKLAALERIRDIVVEKEEQREKIADDMVALGYPDVLTNLAQKSLADDHDCTPEGDTDSLSEDDSPQRTRWKTLELAYLICVKISDKSAPFCKALTDAGLLECTTDTLSREEYRNKCTGKLYCETSSWMLELIGNCYDDISRDDELRGVCKRTTEWYLECGSEALRLKAGQTMLMMLLKDRVEERLNVMTDTAADTSASHDTAISLPDFPGPGFSPYNTSTQDMATGGEDVAEALAHELIRRMLGAAGGGATENAGDVLDDFMDAMSPEKRKVREAEHLADIGMHNVYVQNIKRWMRDPSRWLAFNEDGKMWGCVHEWFSRVSVLSRASDAFCTAVCEAGIVPVLADIITDDQIHEAHTRNNKVKEVVSSVLGTLLSVSKLRAATKWLRGLKMKDSIKGYVASKDINIRGLSVLVLANIEAVAAASSQVEAEESNVGVAFTTDDIDLLLATYLAYKSEGEQMGTYLSRTNFPELCVQELRHHIASDDVFQEETWERIHRLLAAMHLFSNKSADFAASLCEEDIVTPLTTAICSPRLRARLEDENSRRMLQVCLSLVHHCVRINFKDQFLVPNLWENIHFYATLSDPENPLRWAAFLAFSHIHAHVTKRAAVTSSTSCDQIRLQTNTASLRNSSIAPSTSSDSINRTIVSAESRNVEILNQSLNSSPNRTRNVNGRRVAITKFPSLRETHEDIKFLNKLWHTTNEQEETVLGDFIAATGGAEVHALLLSQMVARLSVITCTVNLERVKMLLANMNNLAIESEAFSCRLCAANILRSLTAIVLNPYIDTVALNPQEEMLLDHTLSAISACSKYQTNLASFRETRAIDAICRFINTATIDDSLRRRAWSTLIHIRHHDASMLLPHLLTLKKTTTNAQNQKFYYKLYQTGRADRVQNMIADFLIDIQVPEVMAAKLKELVGGGTLVSDWDLTKHLLHNMWNYSDVSEVFTNHFRDAGVFETLQLILRDTAIRNHMGNDQRNQDILRASINILFNCSQYDSNRPTLTTLRLVNDLLHFSNAEIENQHIKTSAILTTAFLVNEDNAHLIRADSKSGVIRFILEKLEDTLFAKDHRSGGFSTLELLKSLCRVAMNDANKIILVYDGILTNISPLLEGEESEEKRWASKMVWMLAFVEDNKRAIRENERLVNALEKLARADDGGEVRSLAQGALFELEKTQDRINRALERQVRSPAHRAHREQPRKFDVYLSHHPDQMNFFLHLRDALQQEGLKAVTSQGYHGNNPTASMADMMERSRIFLVELSHAYQHSELCRSEAEYARDLLKPVVPLRLERPFKSSGWLSRLVAGRVYVDFSRSPPSSNDFEDRVEELARELRLVLSSIHRKEHVE